MELQQLRYFLAAADVGSFTGAAEQLGVSQPTLSQHIARLEQQLGEPLFVRRGRGVALTDSGRLLVERARQIVSLADETESELRDMREGARGRIAVTAIPTLAPYLLPPLLEKFTDQFPEATIEIFEETTDSAVKLCLSGAADLALLALPIQEQQLHVEPLFEDPLLALLPRGHRLARQESVAVADLIQEPFILLNEAHCLTDNVLSFCHQQGQRPALACRSSQLLTVQELVSLGWGVSLAPAMAANIDRSEDRVYRAVVGNPRRTIVMAWRKSRVQSLLVKNFVQFVRHLFAHRNGNSA